MPRKTNLDFARETLARVRAEFEAFKLTPEYAKAMKFRADKADAEKAVEAASRKENEAYQRVGTRLGIFTEDRYGRYGSWAKEFEAAVSKAFGGMDRNTAVVHEGRRRAQHPYYDVLQRVAREIVGQDPEYQAALAEYQEAGKLSNSFYGERYEDDKELRRFEWNVYQADAVVKEEEQKRASYEERRDEAKARKAAIENDAEFRLNVEQEAARQQKILSFLKDGKAPEELLKAFAPKKEEQ